MLNFLPSVLDIGSIILILLLVALGLMVVFGLMRVINMAHGEFFLFGAYGVFFLTSLGLPFSASVVLSSIIVGILGLIVESLLIRFLVKRTLDTILATWGLSIVLKQIVVLLFGPGSVSVELPIEGSIAMGSTLYPAYRLIVMLIAIIVVIAIILLYRYTTFGLAVRASIEKPEMASALGINSKFIYRISFGLGAACAGLAGALVAPLISVDPQMGLSYLVPSFLAILIGGAGSLAGAIGGTIFIGGLDGLLSLNISSVLAQIVVFSIAVILIRFRPRDLLGSGD
jgi:branched-chain amino acid transport system permease protein/urea transport system permease protein